MVDETVSPPAGVPERPLTTEPPPPAPSGEILAVPPRKSRSKIVLAILSLSIILASLPIAVYLVKQRQEIRKEAGACPPESCTGTGYLCAGDCACNWELNKGVRWHYKCVNGQVESYNILDGSCNSACPEEPSEEEVSCSAGPWGVSATNNTNNQVCGEYFKGKCQGDYSCFCGGGPTSVCLGPGESMSKGLNLDGFCGSWQTDINIGGCHASDHGCEYCEGPIPDGAPTCDPSQLNMTVSPESVTLGNQITFSLSGSQGSTWVSDSFSGGVSCSGFPITWPTSQTCNTTTGGTFTWTHYWKNCAPNDCSITSDQCSKSTPYTIAALPTPRPLTCVSLGGEPDPSGLSPGDEVTLTCTASSDPTVPINHFEFRVSSDAGTPVELPPVSATKTNGEYEGEINYEIPNYGCYKVECRACTATECTAWGQAQ